MHSTLIADAYPKGQITGRVNCQGFILKCIRFFHERKISTRQQANIVQRGYYLIFSVLVEMDVLNRPRTGQTGQACLDRDTRGVLQLRTFNFYSVSALRRQQAFFLDGRLNCCLRGML